MPYLRRNGSFCLRIGVYFFQHMRTRADLKGCIRKSRVCRSVYCGAVEKCFKAIGTRIEMGIKTSAPPTPPAALLPQSRPCSMNQFSLHLFSLPASGLGSRGPPPLNLTDIVLIFLVSPVVSRLSLHLSVHHCANLSAARFIPEAIARGNRRT